MSVSLSGKILPESHHYASCPDEDIPLKTYYKGFFDEVYICFHPFIKPVSMDYNIFSQDTWITKKEILKHCEAISWSTIIKELNLSGIKQLDKVLRLSILGLGKKHEDPDLLNLFNNYLDKNKIISPSEGVISDFICDPILSSLLDFGHKWVWIGDEFCTSRKLHYIEDLINDDDAISESNFFTYDNEILVSTHWDSHFTLLCGDKDYLEKTVTKYNLEGFYCNDLTEIYWSIL